MCEKYFDLYDGMEILCIHIPEVNEVVKVSLKYITFILNKK